MSSYREEHAPIIVDADQFELIDSEGNRYLDGISSLWCNVHGHRVPQIDAAIRAQLDRVAHTTLLGLSSEPSIRLARKLVEIVPQGLTKVFFSDDGSTAAEAALKIAFQYHRQRPQSDANRTLFATVRGAYHGDSVGAVSVGSIELFHRTYGPLLFPTVSVPSPVTLRIPSGFAAAKWIRHCEDELERTLREHAPQLAAMIVEPLVQGAAGILIHPPGYLRRVRELTRELNIPLIADEVAVGFGRTGTMFACEQEQVRPDIMCLSKGLTGGYLPLAATLVTDEIYNAFLGAPHAEKTFFHGHTYTGNSLGCAAALASLELFQSHQILSRIAANSQRLHETLAPLRNHPHVAEIRQKGIMVGIELVADRRDLTPFPIAQRIGHQVTLAARARGVILRPLGDTIVLMPAPAMPAAGIDRLCEVAIAAIDEVT